MVSDRKAAANRRNAQLSPGPRDASRTRLNALRHGILAQEALITVGEGKEDGELFAELQSALRQSLAPEGALEELLVEQIVTLAWR